MTVRSSILHNSFCRDLTAPLLGVVITLGLATTPAAFGQACVGDCDGSESVTVDEIVTMVNIALGQGNIEVCVAGDPSGDGTVTVDEILQAVNNALNGCTMGGECTTATVTVSLDFDPLTVTDLAGVTVDLDYPVDAVSMPGSGNDASVFERVMDITGVSGFFDVSDNDSNSDSVDDRLRSSVVVVGATISPGGFEVAQFDCEPGATLPDAAEFICSVDAAADSFGNPLNLNGLGCSVEVMTP